MFFLCGFIGSGSNSSSINTKSKLGSAGVYGAPLNEIMIIYGNTYDFYKVAITNNASATFSYRIYVYEGLNIVSSGHTVNVVGYCKANYSGTDWEYLIVADGWNGGTVKYINITDIDFIDKYGVRFYIS